MSERGTKRRGGVLEKTRDLTKRPELYRVVLHNDDYTAMDFVIDILETVSKHTEWVALVTADHGNCEKMIDENGDVHTAHTTEPVDFIVFDPTGQEARLVEEGRLADVAPTVLGYMRIAQPEQMSGRDLVRR